MGEGERERDWSCVFLLFKLETALQGTVWLSGR